VEIRVATTPPLRYISSVSRGQNIARCPAERASRHRQRSADIPVRFEARKPCASAGFSLLELLIVAALILILTTMYWSRGSPNRRRVQQGACQQNLLKIYVPLEIYANDHDGKFPDGAGARTSEEALQVLVPRCTVDTSVFTCPASKDSPLPMGEPFGQRRISYAYYAGRRASDTQAVLMSDRQVNTQAKNAGDFAFSTTGKPPGNNHGQYGGNFLFGDGHVETTKAQLPFSLMLTQGVALLNPKP
jgi:prepilin-type N-terminal cleavage/methylation domain-containing protein/prepilin-type processing-associated H-X9-DG protein